MEALKAAIWGSIGLAIAISLSGCSSAPSASTLSIRTHGRTSGYPAELDPVSGVALASSAMPGAALYRLDYWSRGLKVEGYLIVPPGSGPFSLIVSLHGGDMFGDDVFGSPYHFNGYPAWNAQRAAGNADFNHAVVFLPNFAGYGGSQGNVGSPYSEYIDTVNGMVALRRIRGLDLSRQTYVVGASVGGLIALLLASKDTYVRALLLDSPYVGAQFVSDWLQQHDTSALSVGDLTIMADYVRMYGESVAGKPYQENSPNYCAIRIPVLIIAGTRDPYYPVAMLKDATSRLRKCDPTVTLRVFPGGHAPSSVAVNNAEWTWAVSHFRGTVHNP